MTPTTMVLFVQPQLLQPPLSLSLSLSLSRALNYILHHLSSKATISLTIIRPSLHLKHTQPFMLSSILLRLYHEAL